MDIPAQQTRLQGAASLETEHLLAASTVGKAASSPSSLEVLSLSDSSDSGLPSFGGALGANASKSSQGCQSHLEGSWPATPCSKTRSLNPVLASCSSTPDWAAALTPSRAPEVETVCLISPSSEPLQTCRMQQLQQGQAVLGMQCAAYSSTMDNDESDAPLVSLCSCWDDGQARPSAPAPITGQRAAATICSDSLSLSPLPSVKTLTLTSPGSSRPEVDTHLAAGAVDRCCSASTVMRSWPPTMTLAERSEDTSCTADLLPLQLASHKRCR